MIAGRSFDAPAKRPSAAVSLAMPEVPYEVPVKAYRGRTAHGPASSAPQQPPPQATVTHPEPAQPPRDCAPGAEAPQHEAPARKSVAMGTRVSVGLAPGGLHTLKQKTTKQHPT